MCDISAGMTTEKGRESMNNYAFKLKAQAWRRDPYYVGSSQPVKVLTVVATSEDEARDEARRVLGQLKSSWYWRFWLVESMDVRLQSGQRG